MSEKSRFALCVRHRKGELAQRMFCLRARRRCRIVSGLTRSGCRQLDRHLDGQRPTGLGGRSFAVPLGMQANLWNHTIRQVARVSIGGSKVRIVVSNEYGGMPLKIGEAEVGGRR